MLSLNGLQMIINYEVVPPAEAQNILRVLSIQVYTKNFKLHIIIFNHINIYHFTY